MPSAFRLSPPERRELKRMSRSQSGRADDARSACILLGLAGGQTLAAVCRSQSCVVNTVKLWRDRFLEGRISRIEMETQYSRQWQKHFSRRLKTGRRIQRLFSHKWLTDSFISVAKHFPRLVDYLIRQTHGKPF